MAVHIGFIGAGDVSVLHAEGVRRSGARLVGLWNRTADRAQRRAEELGCRVFPSAQALVREVDAVFVLTNLESHLEYTLLALESGKPVLVEKPVGATIGEIEAMKSAAARAGVVCMPGHNYIYEAGMARARELVETGALGRIVSVYVLYNIHHPEDIAARYPGVVRQILTHHSYILLYVAGRPKRLAAMQASLHYAKITQEDIAMVQMELENGALAHFCASFAADDHAGDPWTVMVKIIGTEGSTRYSYRDWVESKAGVAHSQTYTAYQGSISNEVRHFVDVCMRGGRPLSTLDDAVTAQRMIEACERSIAERRIVELGV